ncbi:LINE-1 reverse transcriptase -like protein [Trametes pubescens]|uniref:LINE-1 reverse transcriptase-like protein n=1 Tax=Trametes pubescens TaxID=154538 RepID=A0A1M2VEG4_TRAPU|nr:LINE-1 reverse transcriptase -like protein [Trametes pubescens]
MISRIWNLLERNHHNQTQTANAQRIGEWRFHGAEGADPIPAGADPNESAVETGGGARLANATVVNADGGNEARQGQGTRRKNRTKARIRVATLNMRGYGTVGTDGGSDKWMYINQLVRDEKIGILALQETHLDEERVRALNDLFGRYLHVYHSALEERATGAGGVAFAVNKRLVDPDKCKLTEVMAGRALAITAPWAADRALCVVNVYGPNVQAESAVFWEHVQEQAPAEVDMLLGDFNLVEDGIDRIPVRMDTGRALTALQDLLMGLRMEDGWRVHNPDLKEFTYMQRATGSQSRLDRIYVANSLHQDADEWRIVESGLPTDHKMAIVSLANRRAPFMGRGRWSMPSHLLTDPQMVCTMKELGKKLLDAIGGCDERTERANPQVFYNEFKLALVDAARARAKVKIPRLLKRLERLRDDLKTTLNPRENEIGAEMNDEARQRHAAILQERVDALEVKLFIHRRRAVASKHWVQSETMSKYWTRPNVAPLPSIVIPELRQTDRAGGGYTTNTRQMADVARAHYDGLQNCDPLVEGEPHAEYISEALAPAKERLRNDQKAHLAERISREEVVEAICGTACNKAPGLDGLPSEVWKTYLRWNIADAKNGAPVVDMPRALAAVFNDIAKHGLVAQSTFTEGWICPIYKKKDTREIVNYRPITLLNSDYKLMTKTLAVRLAMHAPSMIHPDQAGFVPGRRIFDHIQLSKLIIAYTEAEELNGAIVALDQEKAYDRIDHTYLWATLLHMGFPDNFIDTVRNLYSRAESCVIVNGIRSEPFRIRRGVRQGDPMSCLLFDFAIEPLACALRQSTLRGLMIPGDVERLVATLFADDTTIFLGEGDEYAAAIAPTTVWCRASRARFNLEKTEVIPVGTQVYRSSVVATRKLSPGAEPIPANVHVVRDGEAVRSLGAWIGNGTDDAVPWANLIKTMSKNMDGWAKGKPTLLGRKLAVDLEIGGRTQFLAKAQGMPKSVEAAISRMIADFMWNGDKKPRVARSTLHAPVSGGGLNVLHIGARNDAIDLMRLKDYLDISGTRPRWALVADAILARAVASSSKLVEPAARINSFLQKWEVSTRHAKALPSDLRRMILAAKKFGVCCDVKVAKTELKRAMPIWYHLAAEPGRLMANSVAGKCLRDRHRVLTVAQCEELAVRLRPENEEHVPSKDCVCVECALDRTALGCLNPHRCVCAAERLIERLKPKWNPSQNEGGDGLSLTRRRKRANVSARADDQRIVFDPSMAQDVPVAEVFRVFTDETCMSASAAVRLPRPFGVQCEEVEVYTDGSCLNNGEASAAAGSGVWFGLNDPRNEGVRVPHDAQSNQVAEIYAVTLAASKVAPFAPLHLVSDSKYVVDGMTVYLPAWERRGWIGVANASILREMVAALRARSALTTLRWVKGHAEVEGNEEADKLARLGAERMPPFRPVALPNYKYMRSGASLARLTQSLAYEGVKRALPHHERKATRRSLAVIALAMANECGSAPVDAMVWGALRKDPVSRKVRDFLWKAIHGAHRVGAFWAHIPGYEERGRCRVCNVEDSMKHILTECEAPGQKLVWLVVKSLLGRKKVKMPVVSLGLALGAHLFVARSGEQDDVDLARTRAARIILTEAVHIIWALRCERVIGWDGHPERRHSESEVLSRLGGRLNNRIQMDQGATNIRAHKKKALGKAKVLATWRDVLADEQELPEDWLGLTGVLVGIPPVAELCDPG